MQAFTLVNPGMEKAAQQEIRELLKAKAAVNDSVLEFEVKDKKELISLIFRSQSSRRILVSLGKGKEVNEIPLDQLNFPWLDFFPAEFSFKVEVEGVKGQENRIELAKKIAGKLFPLMEKNKLKPSLELKKPDFLVCLFFNGENYFLGLDLAGRELNARRYRVFAHQASMKGDMAYYFIRRSGFKAGGKLLVGFSKDGTLAIEAALFANNLPVQKTNEPFSWKKCPIFQGFGESQESQLSSSKKEQEELEKQKKPTEQETQKEQTIIYAFDENRPSIVAARKNSQLAGTKELIDFQKYDLDELDTRFAREEFDCLLFHLTKKDEDKINEIYHQADYILKPKGNLLLLTSARMELSAPGRFALKEKKEIRKGDNLYRSWLMQKK